MITIDNENPTLQMHYDVRNGQIDHKFVAWCSDVLVPTFKNRPKKYRSRSKYQIWNCILPTLDGVIQHHLHDITYPLKSWGKMHMLYFGDNNVALWFFENLAVEFTAWTYSWFVIRRANTYQEIIFFLFCMKNISY